MVIKKIVTSIQFEKDIKHLKDKKLKNRILKAILKIKENPLIGKPLKYNLKGERSIRIKNFRLIYSFDKDILFLLKFEHRKKVYEK